MLTKHRPRSVLCVDEDKHARLILTFLFQDKAFEVVTCKNLEDCLPQVRRRDFSAIILDNSMDIETGYQICREIRLLNPRIPIIFYCGEAGETKIKKAFDAGASEYLLKPTDLNKIVELVNGLIDQNQLQVQT